MADPIVHITNGVPDLGTGNITTLGMTINAIGSVTSGQSGNLVMGAVTTSSPAYTTGQTNPLSLDTTGALRVNVTGTNNVGGTFSSFGSAFPAIGTAAGAEYLSSPPALTNGEMVALQTNVNGALKVDGSAITQPISGTITANQGGAWNVGITGTVTVSGTVTSNQGGAPWSMKPDGTTWAMTSTSANVNVTNASIPITATSLPLPSGASTSANQPTNAAQGSTTSGQTGNLVMGAVTTGNPTYTAAQTSPISLDTSGAVRVNVIAGSGGGGTSSSFGSAFPATGTAIGGEYLSSPPTLTTGQMVALQTNINGALKVDGTATTQPVSGNVGITGTAAVTQSGTWTVQPGNTANTTAWLVTGAGGTFPITAASLPLPTGAATSANQINGSQVTGIAAGGNTASVSVAGALKVDGSAVTQPVSGTFWQATQPVSGTVAATQSGTWTMQPGNTANTTPWLVMKVLTAASNGLISTRVVAAATTNATSLKASAGNIAAIDLFNVAAYAVFLKLYNKASAPTVGTDTPVWTIPIPASGGFSLVLDWGEYFSTGIAYAITKLQADSDTTVLVAGDVTGRIKWV
jgi:hypothetical protein